MHIAPCWICPRRKTCEIRQGKVVGVRGLKLTSIKFKCDILPGLFTWGMRVSAMVRTGDYGGGFPVNGTVMAWKGDRVLVCVDEEFVEPAAGRCNDDEYQPPGTISKNIVKIRPDKLTATGETVPVCRQCRKPMDRAIDGWECLRYGDANGEPQACVAGDPVAWFEEMLASDLADAKQRMDDLDVRDHL